MLLPSRVFFFFNTFFIIILFFHINCFNFRYSNTLKMLVLCVSNLQLASAK